MWAVQRAGWARLLDRVEAHSGHEGCGRVRLWGSRIVKSVSGSRGDPVTAFPLPCNVPSLTGVTCPSVTLSHPTPLPSWTLQMEFRGAASPGGDARQA